MSKAAATALTIGVLVGIAFLAGFAVRDIFLNRSIPTAPSELQFHQHGYLSHGKYLNRLDSDRAKAEHELAKVHAGNFAKDDNDRYELLEVYVRKAQ